MRPAPLLYAHGLPGGPAELDVGWPPNAACPGILPPGADIPGPPTTRAVVVGFSLGAFTALRAAARQPDRVSRLILIAPAAPLELGDFLGSMAGAPVFRAARAGDLPLAAIARAQSLMIRTAPHAFLRMLFAKTGADERALVGTPAVADALTRAFREALSGPGLPVYRTTLRAYVRPWADTLDRVQAPVEIHQGMADTWVPPAMSAALAQRLGPRATLVRHPDLGHYGTLRAGLRRLTG